MSEAKFATAFESIASVVEQAALLPDHRDREVETITVTSHSERREVSVTVEEAKIVGLRLDRFWFDDASAEDVEDLVIATANAALEQWNREQLEQIMSVTPDMKELSAAINTARGQLDDAWAQTLADSKVPPA